MDAQAAFLERRELFDNVIEFKHNKRVPLFSNFWTWKILDAGYRVDDALSDYDLLEKINCDFHELYQFDAYIEAGFRNPMRVAAALGGGFHYVDESGELLLIDDHSVLFADEYLEYVDDILAFNWSKILKRTARPGLTLGELKNAVFEFINFGTFVGKMAEKFVGEYGAYFPQNNDGMMFIPLDTFFVGLSGMRQLAVDLVRDKGVVKEAVDTLFDKTIQPILDNAPNLNNQGCIAAMGSVLFAHSMLSTKNFEDLYWVHLKKIIDTAIANNHKMFIFCESSMLRFAEFFEDIPKGVLVIHPEQDDIFEFRKRLPNIAIAGGMPTNLLGYATPKECVDYAKHLIDELGEGYIFSQDKMMSYRNDATRENLLAVNDFVRGYEY